MPAPSSSRISSSIEMIVGESLSESSSSLAVTASSSKENNHNHNNNNADVIALADSSSGSKSAIIAAVKSTLPSHNNNNSLDDANNLPPRRRVLLPSLGGRLGIGDNTKPLLPATSSVTSISSTAPSSTALGMGGTSLSSSSTSHQIEPKQQQQETTTTTSTRRESLDETAITNHTHSLASHFSSSTTTLSSSSTFTTNTSSSVCSSSQVISYRNGIGGSDVNNKNNNNIHGNNNNNIHDNKIEATSSRKFRPLSFPTSSSPINNTAFNSTTISNNATTKGSTAKNSNNNNNNDEEHVIANSLTSSIVSYNKASSSSTTERVLRYGETIDSLFCLLDSKFHGKLEKEDEMDENKILQSHHWKLCHEICLGSKGNDACAWVEALELSLDGAAAIAADDMRDHSIVSGEEEGEGTKKYSNVGKRLIQLHRRATSRFKVSTEKETLHHKPVLQLWLLYSLVLLKHGSNNNDSDERKSNNDARQTLRHVQRLYFSTRGKEFYKALAMAVHQPQQEDEGIISEGKDVTEKGGACDEDACADAVIASLQQCLEQGSSIVKIVKDQMARLENERLLEGNSVNGSHAAKSLSSAAVSAANKGVEATGVSASKTANVTSSKAVAPARLLSLPHLNPKKDENRLLVTNEIGREPSSTRDVPLLDPTKRQPDTNGNCSSFGNNGDGVSVDRIEPSSSFRAKIASRKKLKTTDRLTPYRTPKSTREGGGGGGLRAILSQTKEEEGNESDDSTNDADNSYITAKRSAESCASSTVMAKRSAESCRSTASSSKDVLLFQDISPIDPECTTSVKDMDLDYLLNWDPTKRDTSSKKRVTIAEDTIKEKVVKKAAISVPKITRNDLGYMMDWNPFDKLEKKPEDLGSISSSSSGEPGVVVQRSTSQGNNVGNNMSTIDEATEVSATLNRGENNVATNQSQTLGSSQDEIERNNTKSRNSSAFVGTNPDTSENNPSRNEDGKSPSTSQESMISISGFERSFLPLIQNKNIIHVENEPYAKLGVIGKGGSCKVYRALSRDCDVVALKKVKIDGLNKAAIDGYANEIALLKRLKGNPAIIQLYSAEVDLERKYILLVMELGEVDLNYVLRQQEILASNQPGRGAGRSSLNMNFIRLTWQQMLTAVHSIHEERIIHSDLKPANFLFVRGALKLIDFGIAKAIEKEDTTNIYRETLSGTLSYMSPEAIMDTSTNAKGVRVNKCGRPSDIWSLGCILYQMVYGKTPFADCHGIPQKVLAITNVNHEIHFPDEVDESAISAMKLCLQRNPKQRPPIMGANGLLNEHCFLHGRKKV